uniref:EGF-like domain-containing protein n=1 Tax=Palpitomonas bilix TaxID=652834 RepID=A0A7S3DL49_9EUKA|mmetsp:Transcript_42518/g.109295  ORF Transcript_42518/g.109295 Transcript_42518/m.109295 type:complete len:457 (+) Transcript_42518:104-1474(+)
MSIVGVVWWRWTFVLSILIVHTHFVSGLQYSSTDFLIRAGVPQFSLCTSQRQVSASASTLRQTSTQLKAVEEGTSSRPPPPLVGELQLHTREVRTSAMNDASARLQRDSAIHAWRERLAFLKQARAQLDDRFLRVSSDVRDPKRSVLRSLASLPRHDLAETSGKLKSTLQTRVRVRVEMYPSPPSSLQSQPCPAWSPGVSNTTCRDGFDIARSEAECDKYVPMPGLDRSKSSVAVAATLPTSSPSQRMYCVDERGVFDPPSFALCSLPAWNVTEPSSLSCSVCSSGHFGSNCTACTSSCLRNGRCNDSLSGDGSCTCDEGWSGAECDACLPLHFGASCTPCPSTCGSNGHCNDTAAGDGTCICSEGWEGGECDCVVGSRLLRCLSPPSVWTGVSQTPVKLLHPGGNQDDELAYGGPTLSSSGLVLAAASPYHSNKGVVLVWERNLRRIGGRKWTIR